MNKVEKELKKLVVVLNSELKAAQEFLEFSQKTNSSLEKLNFSNLRTSSENSPKIISKLLDLEDERTQILLNIAQELEIPCEKLTISELAKLVSPYSKELIAIKTKLAPIFQKIVKLSRINKYLINRSILFMDDRIRVFRSANGSVNTYGGKGEINVEMHHDTPLQIDTQI